MLDVDDAVGKLVAILTNHGSVDAVVISAGIGDINQTLELDLELSTIATNVTGFTAMAATVARHFEFSKSSLASGRGVLVGISSIAGCVGSGEATSYAASKAYQSNYLQGLRLRWRKQRLPLQALDVRPGFVDTAMAKGDGDGGGLILAKTTRAFLRASKDDAWHLAYSPYSIRHEFDGLSPQRQGFRNSRNIINTDIILRAGDAKHGRYKHAGRLIKCQSSTWNEDHQDNQTQP